MRTCVRVQNALSTRPALGRRRRIQFVEIEYDDTWLRDSGPITLTDGTQFRLIDFRFTGWGGKFAQAATIA